MAGASMNVEKRMSATVDLAGVGARTLSGDHSFDDRRFPQLSSGGNHTCVLRAVMGRQLAYGRMRGAFPDHLTPYGWRRRNRYLARLSRTWGFRRFLPGSGEYEPEWWPTCIGHNLLKLLRYGAGLPGKGAGGNSRKPWIGSASTARLVSPSQLIPLHSEPIHYSSDGLPSKTRSGSSSTDLALRIPEATELGY